LVFIVIVFFVCDFMWLEWVESVLKYHSYGFTVKVKAYNRAGAVQAQHAGGQS
jgi:hypothetical protein